jgi:hypothetical protein
MHVEFLCFHGQCDHMMVFFWIFDLCSGTRYNTLKKRTASFFRVTEMVQVKEKVTHRINCVTCIDQPEGI